LVPHTALTFTTTRLCRAPTLMFGWLPRPQAIPVRNTYTQGGGVPHLIALYQDRRQGKRLALSYAMANGGGKD
jgi:hypothetical protein